MSTPPSLHHAGYVHPLPIKPMQAAFRRVPNENRRVIAREFTLIQDSGSRQQHRAGRQCQCECNARSSPWNRVQQTPERRPD